MGDQAPLLGPAAGKEVSQWVPSLSASPRTHGPGSRVARGVGWPRLGRRRWERGPGPQVELPADTSSRARRPEAAAPPLLGVSLQLAPSSLDIQDQPLNHVMDFSCSESDPPPTEPHSGATPFASAPAGPPSPGPWGSLAPSPDLRSSHSSKPASPAPLLRCNSGVKSRQVSLGCHLNGSADLSTFVNHLQFMTRGRLMCFLLEFLDLKKKIVQSCPWNRLRS